MSVLAGLTKTQNKSNTTIKSSSRTLQLMNLIESGELDTTNYEVATVTYDETDSAIYVDFLPRPKNLRIKESIERDAWKLGKEVGLDLKGFTGWNQGWLVIEV